MIWMFKRTDNIEDTDCDRSEEGLCSMSGYLVTHVAIADENRFSGEFALKVSGLIIISDQVPSNVTKAPQMHVYIRGTTTTRLQTTLQW